MRRITNIATLSTSMLAAALLVTGGSTAQASHCPTSSIEPLNRLALRLEGATRELSYNAEHYSYRASHRERRALHRFDALQDEARDFRVTLQRRGPLAARTEREYGQLIIAFERAERALYDTRTRRVVTNDFREVKRRLNQLDRALQREAAQAANYRRDVRIGRAFPRYGISEIAYEGRIGRGDVRIRYAKREDDYDDGYRRDRVRYQRKARYDDDDSSD